MLQKSAAMGTVIDVAEKGARVTVARDVWLRREQLAFLEALAATGDPAKAVVAAGRSLDAAYRRREAVPEFAADWQRAVTVAWEQVEARALARLLGRARAVPKGAALDSRVMLAILQRRLRMAAVRAVPAQADPRRVSAMRSEILRLAGPEGC